MKNTHFKLTGVLSLVGLSAIAVYGIRAKADPTPNPSAQPTNLPILAAAGDPMPPDGPGPDAPPPPNDRGPDNGGPGGPPDGGPDAPPPRGPHGGPPELRALQRLTLTDDQKQKIDPIMNDFRDKQQKLRDDMLKQMKDVLTPDQFDQFQHDFRTPPRPRDQPGNRPDGPPDGRPDGQPDDRGPGAYSPAANPPAADPKADAGQGPAINFTGGHETDPRDHGRPVVLVAAGLNVAPQVFRDAFSNVIPAAGGQAPDPDQVKKNKATLLKSLSPYNVDNDLLDTVSNYYRYSSTKGEMWRTVPAEAHATITGGKVTAITITNPGAGYSSPPTITIPGFPNLKATATVWYGQDLKKNGSIQEIKIDNQ